MECYNDIVVTKSEAEALEKETRLQSSNNIWHRVRSPRLTSTSFKSVYSRKADFEQLATSMQRTKKTVQTTAMKRGLDLEPLAAAQYTEVTGNQVQMCGFVINPNAPHLGTSPDRKVLQPGDNSYGLLEIKCPAHDSITDCKYLQKHPNNTYNLKHNHMYYYQITGQMGITGMPWCDFFVRCDSDYHLERIHFDPEMWGKIKVKLDWFFFEYFLPALCR